MSTYSLQCVSKSFVADSLILVDLLSATNDFETHCNEYVLMSAERAQRKNFTNSVVTHAVYQGSPPPTMDFV